MNKKVNWGFIVIGIALLCVGTVYPSLKLVVVVTDNTPPYWLVSSGSPVLYPIDQEVYSSISFIQVGVGDIESSVMSVVATIDGTQYNLSLYLGTPSSGFWRVTVSLNDAGTHSIKYVATNGVGLSTTYSGQFYISMAIQGNWYINNIAVSSPNQTLYFKTLTLNFKFVKTSGIDDSMISCNVAEGDTQVLALTYQGSSTWTGSYMFTGGSHTLALKASDGVNMITMSLLNVNFGGVDGVNISTEQLIIYAIGGTFIALGGYGELTRARVIKKKSHLR